MVNNVSVVNYKNCFSCRSCFLSCPKNAIEMIENEEGFFYPSVDKDKCIDCGLCLKVCPTKKEITKDIEKQISKVIYLKDEKTLKESTSGGAFAGFAEYILEKQGVVFGAAYDDELNVNQIYVEDVKDLYKLKGSKYVESFTNDSYLKVKEFLEQGRYVLYSGTPCQIAGLKSFLNKDYEKLITLDLICHGVPSRKLFKKYLEWFGQKHGGKIIYYGFRDKDVGGWSCGGKTKIKTKTKTKTILGFTDPYYASFLRCETYRESCYSCPYSSMNRPGDITIGDFFEAGAIYPDLDKKKGISLIIINNEKGRNFFSLCEELFHQLPVETKQYVDIKSNLKKPSPRRSVRDNIYDGIDSLKVEKFFLKFKETWYIYRFVFFIKVFIRKLIPNRVKKVLKTILGR